MYLLRNFLKDPKQYAKAEKLWVKTWLALIEQLGQEKQWEVPWFEPRFANGEPFRDGNPIFTAIDRSRGLVVRIIQMPHAAEGEPDLISWNNKFAAGDPEEADELVIACVLSDETLAQATKLMTKWAAHGRLAESSRNGGDRSNSRTSAPRRQRVSRV